METMMPTMRSIRKLRAETMPPETAVTSDWVWGRTFSVRRLKRSL